MHDMRDHAAWAGQDGVRDPFRWSRFASPVWMAGLMGLVILVSVVDVQRVEPRTRGEAVRVAHAVVHTGHETIAALQARQADEERASNEARP